MTLPSSLPRRRPTRPFLAVLVLTVLAVVVTACSSSTTGAGTKVSGSKTGAASSTPPASSAASTSAAAKPGKPVHVKLTNADGSVVGIGMPIIAYFSVKITSAADLIAATKVTVNDQPAEGAWYFETSAAFKDYPVEGHWRMEHYWPGHAQIHMDLPLKGKSAGAGLTFDDSLTSDFSTGPATVVTVDNSTHQLTVVSDGKTTGPYPVALGAESTRTRRGYKVIMEKLPTVCMHDVNNSYNECGIKLDQRLTYDGEYLHSAPWNITNIKNGVNSSNGCTNLLPTDAKTLYDSLEVGDVVYYPNADGKKMQIGDGYGDWNVSWALWQTGGLISTK